MEDKYFIIHNGDGDTTVTQMTKTELLEAIVDKYWGDSTPLSNIPNAGDTNYWGEGILIIKGKIVTPEAEQVVTKYKID